MLKPLHDGHDSHNRVCHNNEVVIAIDARTEPVEALTTMAVDDTTQTELRNRWIVDPGSNTHVVNTEAWKGWRRTSDNPERRSVNAGNSCILITAWGTMKLVAHTPNGQLTLELTHVAYVEGFLTSVLGLARCRSESIHFDSGRDVLYMRQPSNVIAQLEYNGGHWLIDAEPSRRPPLSLLHSPLSTFGTSYRPSYAPKPANVVDRRAAHQIWGHPGRKAVNQLESNVTGIQLTGDHMDCLCQTCTEARMTHIISRRPAESRAQRPFYRIAIDLIYIIPMGEECIDGSKYAAHSIDEYSKWHEIATIKRKDKPTLTRWFMALIRRIQRVYDADVVAIRCDNEKGFGNDLINTTEELGMLYEPAPPGTKEPNGLTERAGGVLTQRARAMRIHAHLPKNLSHEMYRTAAYILNRTPTEALGWKTPYEIVWGRKPLVAHMRPIGCRAYVYNRDLRAADKLESRTLIGHLVGYQGTNIFRIWLPTKDTVIVTRDVTFEPTLFFDGIDGYASTLVIEEVIELLEYPEMPQDDDISIEDLLTARQRQHSRQTAPVTSAPTAGGSQVGGEMADDALKSNQPKEDTIHVIPKGYRLRGEKAPQDVNLNPTDTNLIISGKRSRKLRDLNNFAVQVYAERLGPEPLVDYLRAFSTEILCDRASASADKVPRIHQSQLPPLPKSENQLNTHMFGDQFRHAIEIEWRDLRAKGVFGHTEQSKATADSEILPLMWVFSYKTDGDGYLSRFKARLVVRGDLQAPIDDTYAATLAIRNFRALIAIANYFDLELKQYDVPTAFLNAKTNRKLYAETPKAFRHIEGEIMLVLRALYGLKEAPILWYNELRRQLVKLGLKPVEGFPCLYTSRWLILFVYVDDIVMAFHRSNAYHHRSFEKDLVDLYNIKAMGDLTWFLGIRIVRDRALHKTWLVQDAFIDKVCARFSIEAVGKAPDVPLTENWMPQSTEETDTARTKLYQQLVGSLAYIAVWGRPDVARTHVVFACHLTNPGQSHVSKIRQTWRYLLSTKALALEASASAQDMAEYLSDDPTYRDPLFFGSSDASYADEPETRRSSQGYAFKFGGLMIDWKSTVQRTVTKSTTESELLSLSLAASQMEEWMRFFAGIDLTLDCTPTIWCDNQQTVGIVTKEHDKLHTKIKHVDIHQLWIRQEVTASRINVKWVPTDHMPADGLTKVLPKQKFMEFVRQLGLVDITERLRGLRQANGDDLDGIYIH
ncbi:Pol protein [Pyrenophora tritici-repentis]|uniref:Pol protein n=1 Tax=Pyrenophora tritici-repentis TaxID=45151 RepID=A0A922NFT4_9PLEO|nr:Pol protein [Pyrenophora tritici-repentis]KAI1684483.1 Pol protein [Pyrenophora tritici-repentis]